MRGSAILTATGKAWLTCLALLLLCLGFMGCQAQPKPLSPAAAAFRRDLRETLGKLSKVLVEPVCQGDVAACERAINSLYPEAPRDTMTFPFHVGIINQKGILIYTIPPLKNIGDDYSHYQAVKDALRERRIQNVRLYAPNGKELFLILSPLRKKGEIAGLLVLRLDPLQVRKKWGLTEAEFLALDLN